MYNDEYGLKAFIFMSEISILHCASNSYVWRLTICTSQVVIFVPASDDHISTSFLSFVSLFDRQHI
jgi:hypothetical protein